MFKLYCPANFALHNQKYINSLDCRLDIQRYIKKIISEEKFNNSNVLEVEDENCFKYKKNRFRRPLFCFLFWFFNFLIIDLALYHEHLQITVNPCRK